MNDTTTKGYKMEMVKIPETSLRTLLEYFEAKVLEYRKMGYDEMAEWAEGSASAYRNILTSYGSSAV
jgi:hypothetical protein